MGKLVKNMLGFWGRKCKSWRNLRCQRCCGSSLLRRVRGRKEDDVLLSRPDCVVTPRRLLCMRGWINGGNRDGA